MVFVNSLLWWRRQTKYEYHMSVFFPLAELPMDVTENILQRLSLRDRLRMSAVCKPWKLLLTSCSSNFIRPSPEIPWLLVPESSKHETVRFRSMLDDGIYGLKIPKQISSTHFGRAWCCCGSSKGWLVMSNEATRDFDLPMNLFLLNPITGATINLPDLRTTPFAQDFHENLPHGAGFSLSMIKMVEVSSSDDHDSNDLVVAAILGQDPYQEFHMGVLVVCRPKVDNAWTTFGASSLYLDHHSYMDILFHNRKLFVAMHHDEEDEVNVDNIQSQKDCGVKLEFICTNDHNISYNDADKLWRLELVCFCVYLVESIHGDLLIVAQFCRLKDISTTVLSRAWSRIIRRAPDDETPSLDYKTMGFEVFKYRGKDRPWEPVHRLDDQVIFLASRGGSTCVPAQNLDSRLQGNHIYFASKFRSDSPQVGVYDLTSKQILHRVVYPIWSSTCWFIPSYGNSTLQMLPSKWRPDQHERRNAPRDSSSSFRTYGYMDTYKYVINTDIDRLTRVLTLILILMTLFLIAMRPVKCYVIRQRLLSSSADHLPTVVSFIDRFLQMVYFCSS